MRILLADDHPLFRLALAQAVRAVEPGAMVVEAGDFAAAREDIAAHPDTDLVLLDLHMPGNHGLMGLATLRGEYPAVAVAMISAHDDPATIRRALAYGADRDGRRVRAVWRLDLDRLGVVQKGVEARSADDCDVRCRHAPSLPARRWGCTCAGPPITKLYSVAIADVAQW